MNQCETAFRAWVKEYGYSECTHMVKKWLRERIEPGRIARKEFTKADYKRLYRRQNGVCPHCNLEMAWNEHPGATLHIDHFDPNAEDYNGEKNIAVLHKSCNLQKGAKTPQEIAKLTGVSVASQIQRRNFGGSTEEPTGEDESEI